MTVCFVFFCILHFVTRHALRDSTCPSTMQDADGSPCDEGDFGRLHGLANEKLCGKVVMCDVMRDGRWAVRFNDGSYGAVLPSKIRKVWNIEPLPQMLPTANAVANVAPPLQMVRIANAPAIVAPPPQMLAISDAVANVAPPQQMVPIDNAPANAAPPLQMVPIASAPALTAVPADAATANGVGTIPLPYEKALG